MYLFKSFAVIPEHIVKVANGTPTMSGKGTVKIYFGHTALVMDAYYALKFTTNIVAFDVLSDHVEVLMTSSLRPTKACMLFKKGSLNMKDIIWETTSEKNMYPIQNLFKSMSVLSFLERQHNGQVQKVARSCRTYIIRTLSRSFKTRGRRG